jgi:signal transduction histidine kinase
MLLKAKINALPYTKLMLISILFISVACIAGDLLMEKFLKNKEQDAFFIASKNIAKNILDTEKQIEERLKTATLLLEKYLQENPGRERIDFINFTKLANVDRATIHSVDGKKVLGSSSEILENQKIVESMKTYNLLDRVVDPTEFLSADHNVVIFPMGRDTVTGVTSKPILRLSKKLDIIMSCAIEVGVADIIKSDIVLHPQLQYISVSTPSGTLFADSKDSINIKIPAVETYEENIKTIENTDDKIKLQLCFGGLQKENAIRIIDKTVNSKNQYFYVLTTVFSKAILNKQLLFLRIMFISIAILLTTITYLTIQTFYNHKQYHESLKRQAEQVHHDIANPVQSLDWGLKTILRNQKYDEKATLNLINQAQIIKGVIHDLYYLHDNNFDEKNIKSEPELLYPILESVAISSNSAAGTDRQVILNRPKNPFILTNINNSYLRRSLLNLAINAIQATNENGVITLNLQEEKDKIVITITDNGIGIDPQTIKKLNNGEKINSKTGRGLGFGYAKKVIEHFGGKIEIKSKQNQGTTQIITLPLLTDKPAWFIDKIDPSKYSNIVILDDDGGIQEIYQDIFKNNALTHITKIQDFEDFLTKQDKNDPAKTLFIMDYSVDSIAPTGIDLIKKYNLQANAILITNMYLEQRVKDKCAELNIKLLPKSLLGFLGL